jgi:MurNAc alpha-1-phosphate uridylyltransferase
MKAMILAAGRGERMLPLTAQTPKPLLEVAGKPLIQHTIERLVAAGFTELVINVAYLAQQIIDVLADGRSLGARIVYSNEGDAALETAGGIIQALPLLGDAPFLVLSADIACNFPYAELRRPLTQLAHLIVVANPPHHPEGDFCLTANGKLNAQGIDKYTFSGIGVYQPQLFRSLQPGKRKLAPVLREAMAKSAISGEKFDGFWRDIGTVERLMALRSEFTERIAKN